MPISKQEQIVIYCELQRILPIREMRKMKQAQIIVAGHGDMAQVLTDLCQEDSSREFFEFTEGMTCPDLQDVVAVHFGSGRQLPALLDWCQSHDVPLIQGSTGQTLPDGVTVPVVDAPNLSLPIIKLLSQVLPVLQEAFGDMDVTITETHQETKKSVPGTAKVMAGAFGVAEENIVSVRQPAIQRQMGVPEESLDGHGYHWINFQGQGVNITLNVKVNGRRTYAEGALAIADALVQERSKLEARVCKVTDILELMPS